MDIRLFNKEQDYSQLMNWSKARNLPYPPVDFLSDLGLIIDGKCACFLYVGNSKVCLVEGLIANPSISKEERSEALDLLFDQVLKVCADYKCKYINCVIEVEVLKRRLKDINFLFSEKPVYMGLRVL